MLAKDKSCVRAIIHPVELTDFVGRRVILQYFKDAYSSSNVFIEQTWLKLSFSNT